MTPPVTSIAFTDGTGAATLTNGKPYPANRFDNWVPDPIFSGSVVHRQSDLTPTALKLAAPNSASFQLAKIPIRTNGGSRLVAIARRLVAHLKNGGAITINTGDTDGNSYSSVYLAPGATPSLTLTDPNQLEYTFSAVVFSPGGGAMDCNYDP